LKKVSICDILKGYIQTFIFLVYGVWAVTSCSFAEHQLFRGPRCLHLQAGWASETLVPHHISGRQNPE